MINATDMIRVHVRTSETGSEQSYLLNYGTTYAEFLDELGINVNKGSLVDGNGDVVENMEDEMSNDEHLVFRPKAYSSGAK